VTGQRQSVRQTGNTAVAHTGETQGARFQVASAQMDQVLVGRRERDERPE